MFNSKQFPKELSIEIFQYLDNNVVLYCCSRVSKKSKEIIEQMMENKMIKTLRINTYWICEESAQYGYLGILKWLRSEKCHWDAHTCITAARMKEYEILQWAINNDCPHDLYSFRKFVKFTHKHLFMKFKFTRELS